MLMLSYTDDTMMPSSSPSISLVVIVDFNQVLVICDEFMMISVWYDNEMGYSRRLLYFRLHGESVQICSRLEII